MTRYLRLGAVAGAAGGLVMAVVLRVRGEPSIGDAIAIEKAHMPAGAAHKELFTRGAQQVGGMAAAVVYGVAIGLVFAVVFAAVRHRLASRDDWRRSTLLGVVGFVTIYAVAFLKYPPNPPAVGNPNTITERTVLYVALVGWSIVASWAAWRMHRWLRARGVVEHRRLPATALTYIVLLTLAFVVLPGNPDAIGAPATLVWRFRIASLGGAAAYWSVLGLAFGWLCVRTASAQDSESVTTSV
jgi:predicted cobalt transporter CbtA